MTLSEIIARVPETHVLDLTRIEGGWRAILERGDERFGANAETMEDAVDFALELLARSRFRPSPPADRP
jgi:hypothetical protein